IQSVVDALRLGATDYLLKPLRPEVLLERTQQVLIHQEKERRKREIRAQIEALQMELKKLEANDASPIPELPLDSRHLLRGIFNFDLIARRLTINGRAVDLPPTSFDYLLVLARHAPNLVDYQTLVTEAQGYEVNGLEARELAKWHIHHIRQAIEPNPAHPIYLINVRGVGYRLVYE
ncbi:MAG: winged helix-turn-helix domain-containing protein, partial [Anaerolineales bacterium]